MPNSSFYPLEGCEKQAAERKTAYASSVVHLFKSGAPPTPADTEATLVAREADYDSYAPITITAWTGPILAPGSGFEILSPAVLFSVGAVDPVVPNTIGGFWVADAGGIARLIGIFDPPLPMEIAYQGIPLNLLDVFPTGYTG